MDKINRDNYKPLSLLISLLKVFEKVIHMRLLNYLNIVDVIPKIQFQFKSNHSKIQMVRRSNINTLFEKH